MQDPRDEVELHVRWLRLAVGRRLPADGPAPATTGTATTETATTGTATATDAVDASVFADLAGQVDACRRCRLGEERTNAVFGEGSLRPRLVVVGEAPGAEEDRTGRPFVGRAGQLLDRMLAAIGLSRERDVYICNVLKCRPPNNRAPRPDEAAACRPWLLAQLDALGAPILLAVGSHAARLLLRTERGITSLRGSFHTTPEGRRVMPTFHPAYLLRNPAAKREAWEDLQKVAADLGLEIPPR